MNPVDSDLLDMMSAVFARHRDRADSATPVADWNPELWARLAELGLTRLTGPEASGGSGAGWPEAAALIRAAVRHGVRVPTAEHDLLACWLLETNGHPVDDARRTICILDDARTAAAVPWAAAADRVVTVWRDGDTYRVADVPGTDLRIVRSANLAGEPRDTVTADIAHLTGIPIADSVIHELRRRSALVRALQVCAALDRILDMSVTHAVERSQFGRPLAKFQAVQHAVADIASEASLARAATDAALAAVDRAESVDESLDFLVAVARSCAGHAASVVVRNAHQIHGALGTTREHRLHEFTQAALAWRSEYGTTAHYDRVLTETAMTRHADLWSVVTG